MAIGFAGGIRELDPEILLDVVFADDDEPGCYVTDGITLYRLVGHCGEGDSRMVVVEDCRSLELILVRFEELLTAGLRLVSRAGAATA